ncbi:MAG: 16S rRNA (guanine(527)-N(7))-methyltransferase RsmG [Rickettsiales bacterium]|jgi:16S rRNA (guanine527-N7)-methyltransferase|nr:16S rRNA (guanine(527)-N(7))-methyltransferase RsmG [Rickettsiales bacterium]
MDTPEKFIEYERLLRDWSQRMNLVAPSTLNDIQSRHFADSMQLAGILPENVRIADLGSGAGFPGVVLAVCGWDVVCIESVGKKANFLKMLKEKLDLPNLTIYHGRVEDFIKTVEKAGKELIFTARAFAPLLKILDYVAITKCRLFLLKGREIETEIAAAKTRYDFDYVLTPSQTGDGFVIQVENVRPLCRHDT